MSRNKNAIWHLFVLNINIIDFAREGFKKNIYGNSIPGGGQRGFNFFAPNGLKIIFRH